MVIRLPKLSGKKLALMQVGIAILLFILFIGLLNSIAYTQRVPILTAADLYYNNAMVSIRYVNITGGLHRGSTTQTYNIRSIATLYNDRLYMSIPPPPAGYNAVAHISFPTLIINNRTLTLSDLVSQGFNYVEVYFQADIKPIANTTRSFIGVGTSGWSTTAQFNVEGFFMEPIVHDYWVNILKNNAYNKTIDLGFFALKASSWGPSNPVRIMIGGPEATQAFTASYMVFDIKLYAISEKPVLKALTEPIYSFFAAVYAVLLAVIKRVKEYVVSAFGGFATQFTLTGLIGDPVTALILTMIFITIVFAVLRRRR